MKTKLVLTVILTSFFFLYGCSNNEDNVEESALTSKSTTLAKSQDASKNASGIHRAYPKEQAEVKATFVDIATNITLGAGLGYGFGSDEPNEYMDKLISFHDYSNIFTEFNYDFNGFGYLTDGEGNELTERTLFGTIVDKGGVQKFAYMPGTLKVAVYYGNVANLTFISDFELLIGGVLHPVNNLITLLFVKTDGAWKMVHEHHSPVTVLPSSETAPAPDNILSDFDPNTASPAQLEVLTTFGAIGATIFANSGTGPDNMDELISFHAYGPKFTEFNYDPDTGLGRYYNSKENEATERGLFGSHKVTKFAYKDNTLNIAVHNSYAANVTFISDFEVEGIGTINNLITLLFVKTKGEWKLVHEHHSPVND